MRVLSRPCDLPIVSVAVPCCGLTGFTVRILKGNPQKGTTMETIGIGVSGKMVLGHIILEAREIALVRRPEKSQR